ncbi:hypothetical protein S7711_07908 [Stachybotrys chartarum IBT 7711]|uniref:Zn(2)-C6 fungal-type domain-containing protein n=1 Tax=Stachybotrys chartarum (strain CBS 109288 / IBT 7711) TaxID=1280523 RepID=A0A084B5W6_STACB|nr:hypothetical protein S7711_07908 [Stachybotrys chartarum IBT 7711]KFA70783.1 hypothetical protein S40288_09357 [Stachybotrys chartarum IBT 40288]
MPAKPSKSRRIRPSRARGLRASTGCLTCRQRRIKCDEGKPQCGKCGKSDRKCVYGKPSESSVRHVDEAREAGDSSRPSVSESGDAEHDDDEGPDATTVLPSLLRGSPAPAPTVPDDLAGDQYPIPVDSALQHIPESDLAFAVADASAGLGFSPVSLTHEPLLNTSAFEWFDLLAQDAINDIQRHNNAASGSSRWNFDETSLSRRPSPERELAPPRPNGQHPGEPVNPSIFGLSSVPEQSLPSSYSSWNTEKQIPLLDDDLVYFRHYIDFVGPMLDLYDPGRHFSDVVPHLATRNEGLLKSILAVGARHMSRGRPQILTGNSNNFHTEQQPSPGSQSGSEAAMSKIGRIATQYYYETLQYLSQTLSYQSYADSLEILATATLISTYEMLECTDSFNNSNWERHIRGGFWIQRCQDNNGETVDGLRRAVWWNWVRQDTFSAFLAGRAVMTIWHPRKDLRELDTDEYARRIVYISAKVVQFANTNPEAAAKNIQRRISQASKLYDALQEWAAFLPASFRPLVGCVDQDASTACMPDSASNNPSPQTPSLPPAGIDTSPSPFPPIWIHPSSHAGAIQTQHFARIVLLLHMPTIGGLADYSARQRQLAESVDVICGIANHEIKEGPLTLVHIQALYAAGLGLWKWPTTPPRA